MCRAPPICSQPHHRLPSSGRAGATWGTKYPTLHVCQLVGISWGCLPWLVWIHSCCSRVRPCWPVGLKARRRSLQHKLLSKHQAPSLQDKLYIDEQQNIMCMVGHQAETQQQQQQQLVVAAEAAEKNTEFTSASSPCICRHSASLPACSCLACKLAVMRCVCRCKGSKRCQAR